MSQPNSEIEWDLCYNIVYIAKDIQYRLYYIKKIYTVRDIKYYPLDQCCSMLNITV